MTIHDVVSYGNLGVSDAPLPPPGAPVTEEIEFLSKRAAELSPLIEEIAGVQRGEGFGDEVRDLVTTTLNDASLVGSVVFARWFREISLADGVSLVCDVERVGRRSSVVLVIHDENEGSETMLRRWIVKEGVSD